MVWEEAPTKEIQYFYTVSALAWKRDGFQVVAGNIGGSVLVFETGKLNVDHHHYHHQESRSCHLNF